MTCLDAATGEEMFGPSRLGQLGNLYASPVGANGHVYFCGRDGAVVVELERPASLVHQMVMLGAQRNEIVEVGPAALLPGDDVVDLASTESS